MPSRLRPGRRRRPRPTPPPGPQRPPEKRPPSPAPGPRSRSYLDHQHLPKYTDEVDGFAPLCQDDAVAGIEPYTLVIISFNHADTLPACLQAVASLEPAPARVIVIDNASDDHSADVAASCAAGLPVEVLREESNTGFAAAANRGIRSADTPWVLLLNPDCAPRPDMVERALCRLGAVPTCPGRRPHAPAHARRRPRSRADGGARRRRHDGDPSGRHLDRGAGEPTDEGASSRPAWVFGGTGAATLFRRAGARRCGLPERRVLRRDASSPIERMPSSPGACSSRGWRCLYVPDAVASHRRGFRPEEGRRGHATSTG